MLKENPTNYVSIRLNFTEKAYKKKYYMHALLEWNTFSNPFPKFHAPQKYIFATFIPKNYTKEIETETRRPNFEFSNVIFSRKTRSKNEEEEEEEEKDSSRIDRALWPCRPPVRS